MRVLLVLLSLVCGLLSEPVQALQCPNGVSRASAANLCPTHHWNAGASNITTTTVSITGENDAQGIGARIATYVSTSPYPPGCTSANYLYADLSSANAATALAAKRAQTQCVNYDVMRSGSGAVGFLYGWLVTAGTYSQTITGLPADTELYGHSIAFGGGCEGTYPSFTNCRRPGGISTVLTYPFRTSQTSGGDPGYQLVDDAGQERYIGAGGNDLLDGLSPTNRWEHLNKATCGLPSGTNVALLNTSVWTNEKMIACWGGTSSDRAIVGGYKLNASSQPVWIRDETVGSGTIDTKPVLQGYLTVTQAQNNNNDYRLATLQANGYSSYYDSLLQVTDSGDYTTILNIETRLSPTIGITVAGTNVAGSLVGVIVDGVDIYNMGSNGYVVENGVRDFVMRHVTIDLAGICIMQYFNAGGALTDSNCEGGLAGAGNIVRSPNAKALFHNITATRIFGEGLDAGENSSFVSFVLNRVSNTISGSAYCDGCSNWLVDSNILLGPRGDDVGYYDGPGVGWGGGLGASWEFWHHSSVISPEGIVHRNNLILGGGVNLSYGLENQAYAYGKKFQVQSAGNTVIRPLTHTQYINDNLDNTSLSGVSAVRLNLHWYTNLSGTAAVCTPATDMEFSANHYLPTPTDGDCADATDSTGDPQLAVSNTATWDAYNYANFPTFADAKPGIGSPADGVAGPNLCAVLVLDKDLWGVAYSEDPRVLAGTMTETEWENLLCEDAVGTTRSTTVATRGAMER